MKKLATLAILLAMLSGHALAQDTADTTKKGPTVEQLQEMKRALEAQQQEIDKLKAEAEARDAAVRKMQQQVQDELNQAQAQAQAAAAQAKAAAAQAQAAAAPVEKPGFYPASLSKSMAAALVPYPADPTAAPPPWAVLKISDTVAFRFGAVLQPTFEALQDPNSKGYEQNWYLRRARFNVMGTLGSGVTVFFQTDDPRVGNAGANGAKNVNTGFLIQDAYAQWAFGGKAAAIQAGLFLVPTIRQILTSVSTFLALDLPTWGLQENAIEEANGGRDYGVGFNGALLDDHLTYRVGAFSGYRDPTSPQPPPLGPAAGSRNPPRIAGRIMYDFFDTEYVYSYAGTNLGKKKVLAIAAVGDGQGDYKGYGGDVFFDWPIGTMGAVTLEGDYMHFQARPFVYNIGGTPTTLPEQETFYTNGGYYFCDLKLQPFVRYESLKFTETVDKPKDQQRVGGGFNYYVLGQNFKMTAYYERIMPKVKPVTAQIQDLNRFVVQWQGSF